MTSTTEDEGEPGRRVHVFDVFVIVDWSASSTPKLGKDSIWTCVLDAATGDVEVVNQRTRMVARDHVASVLETAAGRRVLVGFDFSYAYPSGAAAAMGIAVGGEPAWKSTWRHLARFVEDGADNRNNRFEVAAELNAAVGDGHGPFWGAPPRRAGASLSSKKAPGFAHRHAAGELAEFRRTEQRFLDAGRRVASSWQLLGAGSVGSQALVGIPVLHHLRHRRALAERSAVWPFETGFCADPTGGRADAIVHAEIWPGSIPLDASLHRTRDAAQVIGLCRYLASLDAADDLASLFDPSMSDAERAAALSEEGWILAAPDATRRAEAD